MVLKIDTIDLARACDEAMERKFPKSEYNDASKIKRNPNETSLQTHSGRHSDDGNLCVLWQTNSASIIVRKAYSNLIHKPKRMLGGKPVQTPVAEVKLLMNDISSTSEGGLKLHMGVNVVYLYVLDEDVYKLDYLFCADTKELVNLANYIRKHDIHVYDFYFMA